MARRSLSASLAALPLGTGWSAAERRLLPPDVRASGLSMADRRGVHRFLNPAGLPLSTNMLRDKAMFARHAAQQRLPVPTTFDPQCGNLESWLDARGAVIAKPGHSSKGRGVVAFRRAGGQWLGPGGKFETNELARRLVACIARHGVVQELLGPHEQLRMLSPGALPTLRIVTCRNERGDPESCETILRLGSDSSRPVDNFNAGGLAVRLDSSGRCEGAFRANGCAADVLSAHPTTGERIAEKRVPALKEAVALALLAHRSLPEGYVVVGWDIGLSERGPMLIEGNWNPGTDIIQLVGGVGLDQTRLGGLYRFHLERVPEQLWRAAKPIEW